MALDMTGPHQHTREPHYRRYLSQRHGRIIVICVQDFDYHDCEPSRFVDLQAFPTEEEARLAPLSAVDVTTVMKTLDPSDDLGHAQAQRILHHLHWQLGPIA